MVKFQNFVLLLVGSLAASSSGDSSTLEKADEEVALALSNKNSSSSRDSKFGACWKDTTTRSGHVLSRCASGLEQSGLLCYPPCKSGYEGVGPVCWEKCHGGEKDGGVFCYKKKESHVKKSYGRGVGKTLKCPAGEKQDWEWGLGLCYPACPSSSDPYGPLCWNLCGKRYGVDGGAMCCKTKEDCKAEITDFTWKLPLAIVKAVIDRKNIAKEMMDIKNIVEDFLGFELPLCSEVE